MSIPAARLPRLGAQLILNGDESDETLVARVRGMAAAGLSIIRLFLFWSQLEPRKGAWTPHRFDVVFQEADRLGMTVVPTLMCTHPPGWMRLTASKQDNGPVDDAGFWATALAHVEQVVAHFARHRSLEAWILWNEPTRLPDPAKARAAFQAYVQQLYGSVDQLNAVSTFRQYEQFDQVEPPTRWHAIYGSYQVQMDWLRFCEHDLVSRLRQIGAVVRRLDPTRPQHINPHALLTDASHGGQSVWAEAFTVDFLGCSLHPAFHCQRLPRASWIDAVGLSTELIRSANRERSGRFWLTELSGGPATYSGTFAASPTPQEIATWTAEGLATGAEAVVYWAYNYRTDGSEAGDWALTRLTGEPSARLLAARDLAGLIRDNAQRFRGLGVDGCDVGILFSEATHHLWHVQGSGTEPTDWRNRHAPTDAVVGAYVLCRRLGLNVTFVPDGEAAHALAGWPEAAFVPGPISPRQVPVLLAPGCEALDPATRQRLTDYVRAGGVLIADGLIGLKDPLGRLDPDADAWHEALFGCRLRDTVVQLPHCDQGPAWGLWLDLQATRARIMPSHQTRLWALAGSSGAGRTVRIGTVFFQRAGVFTDPQLVADLAALWPADRWPLWRLASDDPAVRLRRLRNADGQQLLLLLNADSYVPGSARLSYHGTERVALRELGAAPPLDAALANGARVTLALPPGAALWYLVSPAGAAS